MSKVMDVRHLHLVGATGEIRTATFSGREHLVVPVVGMVEGVVWAVNSDVPELVTAEELALSPQQWNGRPCFAGHPKSDGTEVTANQPRILEQSFGVIFDTASAARILETRRLSFEAWLDPAKAAEVGPEAEDVVRRLRAGERIEVSVGCYVESKEHDGRFNGLEFHGEWTNIVSDHVAFLAAGEKGACSVAAGCGAPRAAIRHLVTAEGIRREETMAVPKAGRSLKERMKALLEAIRGNEGMSDTDVRMRLDAALRAVEPGYMWIENVYPDDGAVIYCVAPTDEYTLKRRKYTVGADDAVELAAEVEEVEPTVTYEPVVTAATAAKTPCSCGGQQARAAEIKPAISEGAMTMDKKAIATKLAASKHCAIKDVAVLEAKSEDQLKALEEHVDAAEVEAKRVADEAAATAAAATTVTSAPATAKALTRAEIFAADPSIAAIVTEHEARAAAQKKELIGSLKAAAAGAYTEEELDKMDVATLAKLATLAKVETPSVDFSGRGAPRLPEPSENFAPPSAYDKDLKVLRERKPTVN